MLGGQSGQGSDLERRNNPLLGLDWNDCQALRPGLAQARDDADIVGGKVLEHQALSVEHSLPGNAAARGETRSAGLARWGPIPACEVVAPIGLVEQMKGAISPSHQWNQSGERSPAKLLGLLSPVQVFG